MCISSLPLIRGIGICPNPPAERVNILGCALATSRVRP